MTHENVFEQIDQLRETYLTVWEQVCDLESPTEDKTRVDAVGRYFADMAEQRGWKVEIYPQEASGDIVCITMNADSDEKPLCISGHIDTVHPVGSFGPKPVRMDGEKIYGPGVTDCKGGIVGGFLAMDALHRCGYKGRPVQLLLQTDEECSSSQSNKSTINYICERALQGEAFLNLETQTPGKTCISRKGIANFIFTVEGIEGHASRCVTEGASAIADMAHRIVELEKLKDDDGITCNCGIISGGTASNTIAGKCTVVADFRFATMAQWDWLQEHIRKLADTVYVPGCKCTAEMEVFRPAMEKLERNEALLAKVNTIMEKTGLQTLEPIMLRGGSDAADVTAFGGTCLDSLGTRGGGSHSIREFAWIDSLAEVAKRIAAVACYL